MSIDEREFQKLEQTIDGHLEKLRRERKRFRELMEDFDPVEGPADWRHTENLANRLHDLYMGAEHIFERIAKVVDESTPDGDDWHKELLLQMSRSRETRPAVIDAELRTALVRYLRFRHFFRQGYGIDTEWDKMTELVADYEDVSSDLLEAVEEFLEDIRP